MRVVGPLGRGFALPAEGERALLVGGGTGVASLYQLAERSQCAGRCSAIIVMLGARSGDDLMGRADFEALGVEVQIATEDGSLGRKGLVTEILAEALAKDGPARVYACGPTPMMRACADLAADAGKPCVVSLENNMACGFGVCLGCAAPRAEGGFSLVCRDGPVFDARDVAWEGLP